MVNILFFILAQLTLWVNGNVNGTQVGVGGESIMGENPEESFYFIGSISFPHIAEESIRLRVTFLVPEEIVHATSTEKGIDG